MGEALLRRKWLEVVDAEVEESRQQAKRRSLEDVRNGLNKELVAVRDELVKATETASRRQKEEDVSVVRLREALALSEGPLLQLRPDTDIAADLVTSQS